MPDDIELPPLTPEQRRAIIREEAARYGRRGGTLGASRRRRVTRPCEGCGKPMENVLVTARTCGPTCRARVRRARLRAEAEQALTTPSDVAVDRAGPRH